MRVASNVMASIQQAQNRETRNDFNRNVQDKNNVDRNIFEQEKISDSNATQKARDEKVARIKEELKNGTYKLDLAATSDRMARSLLNV